MFDTEEVLGESRRVVRRTAKVRRTGTRRTGTGIDRCVLGRKEPNAATGTGTSMPRSDPFRSILYRSAPSTYSIVM